MKDANENMKYNFPSLQFFLNDTTVCVKVVINMYNYRDKRNNCTIYPL